MPFLDMRTDRQADTDRQTHKFIAILCTYYKNSSGDEMANANLFTMTSYMQKPAPTPIEPTS